MKSRNKLLLLAMSFLTVTSLSSCSSSTSYSLKRTTLGKVKVEVYAPTSIVEDTLDIEKRTDFTAMNLYTTKYANITAYIHRYKYVGTRTSGLFGCSKSKFTVYDILDFEINLPQVSGAYCDSISLDNGQTKFVKNSHITSRAFNLVTSTDYMSSSSGLYLTNPIYYMVDM